MARPPEGAWDNPLLQRMWKLTEPVPESGCWVWLGTTRRKGYGGVVVNGIVRSVHRVGYELLVGPIPEGMQIDHKCCVKPCWNPSHLEAVTPRENTRRWSDKITHCPAGHLYDEETTYLNRFGRRSCRKCEATRKQLARKNDNQPNDGHGNYSLSPEYRSERARRAANMRWHADRMLADAAKVAA